VNPHSFHLRLGDLGYSNALWHFDLVLPDGIGVAIASRWINGIHVERQSFDETSLFNPICNLLNKLGKSLCIVGAEPGVAKRALEKMRNTYPNIKYLGAIDGYQPFDEAIDWVKAQSPDVVIVGMGAPLQESFLLRLRQDGFGGVGISCGGFLDQYIQDRQYYPDWIDRLELRWLYRLVREPRRLWQRYLIQYQAFALDVLSVIATRVFSRRKEDMHLWLARRYARSET
jgi:N-acetylglucosaminyldiphosphoundecaprenol N-acetyl-beta-D-mannosaminyltransferase